MLRGKAEEPLLPAWHFMSVNPGKSQLADGTASQARAIETSAIESRIEQS
jgi:hypothetical protein